MLVTELLTIYWKSNYSKHLSDKTIQNYNNYSLYITHEFGDYDLNKVNNNFTDEFYLHMQSRSISSANNVIIFARRVWNVGKKLDYVTDNPWNAVELAAVGPRQQTWTPAQVDTFVATGLSKPSWKPVAGIVRTAYETAQRLTDVRLLKFSNFGYKCVVITQRKTGAYVTVPVSDTYLEWYVNHFDREGSFDDKYVFAKSNGEPFSEVYLSQTVAKIRDAAGLPKELQARDMRRTAITQMLDAGATTGEIRSVSGHMNEASLKPYMVIHNRERNQAAENAVSKRAKFIDSLSS